MAKRGIRLACCLCGLALLAACGASSAPVASEDSMDSSIDSMDNSMDTFIDIPFESRVVYAGSWDGMPGEPVFAGAATDAAGLERLAEAHREALSSESLEVLLSYADFDFSAKALVAAAIDGGSGSDRYLVSRVAAGGGALSVTIELEPPESGMMGTSDMARFLMLIEIPAEYGDLPVRINGGAL